MKIEIANGKTGKTLLTLDVTKTDTILDVKKKHIKEKTYLYPSRICYKLSLKEKALSDDVKIGELETLTDGSVFYFKDLGPQIGWATVFIAEYTGPIFAYLIFYFSRNCSWIYPDNQGAPHNTVQNLACACYVGHYVKRVLETIFIHRFSKATMPINNLFKNCTYYWGFSSLISYFINHPLYTLPSTDTQVYVGLSIYLFGEIGNLSTHLAFKNMRPPGTKTRVIPMPNGNPFCGLFNLVSCPNYTYEVISWVGFTVLTQTFFSGLFALVGGGQMLQWALGKHRNYKKEFKDYPKNRKAMIPFII
ncbi:hypothetical protein ACHWQZ_G014429 [Mnemiopsis leidyi]